MLAHSVPAIWQTWNDYTPAIVPWVALSLSSWCQRWFYVNPIAKHRNFTSFTDTSVVYTSRNSLFHLLSFIHWISCWYPSHRFYVPMLYYTCLYCIYFRGICICPLLCVQNDIYNAVHSCNPEKYRDRRRWGGKPSINFKLFSIFPIFLMQLDFIHLHNSLRHLAVPVTSRLLLNCTKCGCAQCSPSMKCIFSATLLLSVRTPFSFSLARIVSVFLSLLHRLHKFQFYALASASIAISVFVSLPLSFTLYSLVLAQFALCRLHIAKRNARILPFFVYHFIADILYAFSHWIDCNWKIELNEKRSPPHLSQRFTLC